MRIAVVQHALRPAPAQDLEALVAAAARAAAHGAEIVVLPDVAAISEGPLSLELERRLALEASPATVFTPCAEEEGPSSGTVVLCGGNRTIVLCGDACIDPAVLASAANLKPGIAVLVPGSESELQAEAMFEFALALSTSLASVVIVAEADGAEAGHSGHGGSLIVQLGEVLAEAEAGDDLIEADLISPLGTPESPSALPEVPPLLAGRLAAHRGEKVAVDYPADLA